MKKKTKRVLMKIALIVAIVGGAVHLLMPLGFNILALFGGLGKVIQFIAGALTIVISVIGFKMVKKY